LLAAPELDITAINEQALVSKNKAKRLFALDEEIQEILASQEIVQAAFHIEVDSCETYRDWYVLLSSKAAACKVIKETKSSSLPYRRRKIDFQRYDVTPANWTNFWGQFKATHEDTTIPKV